MKSEDRARIALALVLSVVGAIAVTKAGLDPRDGVLRWLIFSLVTGIIINTQEGKPISFLLSASALAALGLVFTVVWLALLGGGMIPALSGVKVDIVNKPLFGGTLLAALWLASLVGVFACSLSRPLTLRLMHDALTIKLVEAQRIEKLLRLFVAIGGAAGLLLYSVF